MHSLRKEHPYLYRRVLLKAIIHMMFGLILLHFPAQAPSLSYTPILATLGINVIGSLYLVVGVLIIIGLYREKDNYILARFAMWFAAVFNILIFVSLFAVFFQSRTTAFFMVIYGYMTYNIYYIAKDPGWRAIQIIKNIKQDAVDIKDAINDGSSKAEVQGMKDNARLHQ